ncbi:TetR/AcrR family transcriptional regulator [Mycolicibacterium sp. NCC-Tsukiji]|uniref:TetR/AcrR family transcriptional regulator n=1 Tax=Mycolicibacterium sp. NCC-Tsukiji TaxID=2185272 RepID=UPI000EED94BB|nr:TetR/AcrR family transcriptional regulator [Mycolicibacterium sp. NCC-Tsukiji]GCA97804.1 TetR family transcriptional regulator [Mycolicibacterium sp. NCC-Tsukiji]
MRQTQAQRTEATTNALVASAREQFARDGYEATSLNAVATAAGVSKGAVYHHFDNKPDLFAAVFAGEVTRAAAIVARAYRGDADPWAGFQAGCHAFLANCLDPAVQRIMLVEAYRALGWEHMRRLEHPLLSMMETGIEQATVAGRIAPRPPRALTHLLFGAICETAMEVARAPDPLAAHRDAVDELSNLLHGLTLRPHGGDRL